MTAMILMRHGQSEFNLAFTQTRRDPGIHDPQLTPLGHEQARQAADALRGERVRRIIVSPYTRALQTAAPIAEALGAPVVVNPVVRERCAFSCDVGSPASKLAQAWPQHDFSHIEDMWWPVLDEPEADVVARAAAFRAEMAALPDWADTLVVSHWGFLLALTGVSVANGQTIRYDPTAAPPERIVWRP
jgi:broad specificity phosphatase PhoE